MNSLATLICVTLAAAQGQGPTAEDHRVLADMGLKVVQGRLVDASTYVPPRPSARPRGPRQGGPVCYWWFAGGLGYPDYLEPGINEYTSLGLPEGFDGYLAQATQTPIWEVSSGYDMPGSAGHGSFPIVGIGKTPAEQTNQIPPITVFEPGKELPVAEVTKPPVNPQPVSEPSSLKLMFAALVAWGGMLLLRQIKLWEHNS